MVEDRWVHAEMHLTSTESCNIYHDCPRAVTREAKMCFTLEVAKCLHPQNW